MNDWDECDESYEPYLGPPPPHHYRTWYRRTDHNIELTAREPDEAGWQERDNVYFAWPTPAGISIPVTHALKGVAMAGGDTLTFTGSRFVT